MSKFWVLSSFLEKKTLMVQILDSQQKIGVFQSNQLRL